HTRSYGDWSSDVCSSDLSVRQEARQNRGHTDRHYDESRTLGQFANTAAPHDGTSSIGAFNAPVTKRPVRHDQDGTVLAIGHESRSEERRVGKECRYGWLA